MSDGLRVIPERVAARALESLVPEGKCRVSKYFVGSHGYCQITWRENGKRYGTTVHQVVWEHHHGRVPLGFEIDHTCRNRRCARLSHLQLLTIPENHGQGQSRKMHCPQGHPYAGANLRLTRRGRRVCRACHRAQEMNRYARGLKRTHHE